MISFCIKFLICFLKPKPPPKKEPKIKQASKQAGKKSKEVKPSAPEVLVNQADEERDENVVKCVENAREWCHIEYSLLEGVLPKVEINVVTWGEAAKVFTATDCRSVKTAVIDDFVWVYFEIFHKTLKFENEDLVRFKGSKITFTFSQENKKMMPTALNDWPKQFEFCDKLAGNDKVGPRWFSELRQVDPPDEKFEGFSHKLDNYKISRPTIKSIVTMINVKPCEKGVESKIIDVTASLPIIEQSLDLPKKGKGKKTSDLKSKKLDKKGKGSQAPEDNSQLFVDARLLISGKYNACAERKEISETLRYAAVFVNSSKILTDEQDIAFVPFTVNIQSLEAFPVENLQHVNVNNLFARYELANVFDEIETKKCSPQENMTIDETHVFFLSNPEEASNHESLMQRPSMLALAEALLTRRFVVKIYGETVPEENNVEPCIFGDRPTDPFISTPDHEMFLNYTPPAYSTEIFIGSACFNLIQLIKGHSVVEGCSVLTSSPLSSWDPTCDFAEITNDSDNDKYRKALLSKFTTPGVIPESVFLDHNSTLKLRVSLSTTGRLTVPDDQFLLKIDQVSHRAIIIFQGDRFNDKVFDLIEKANRVLFEGFSESISSNVQSVQFVRLSPTTSRVSLLSTRLSDCRKLNLTLRELSRKRDVPKTIITGFFVECEDQSILVLEGMTYVLPPLIIQIQGVLKSEDYAGVICDSSIFFTRRLYTDFSLVDIFRIKLPVALNELLKTPSYYTKKSMTEESLQTLLLLDLLRRCRTLNSACVNQLFPSCKQLISFNKMFGVPVVSDTIDNLSDGTFETHNIRSGKSSHRQSSIVFKN